MNSIFNDDGTVSTDTLIDQIMISADLKQLQIQNKKLHENVSKLETERNNSEELIQFIRTANQQLQIQNKELCESVSKLEIEQKQLRETIQRLVKDSEVITNTNFEFKNDRIRLEESISNLLFRLKSISINNMSISTSNL
jgi:chromosome segregation ATPase